MDTFVFKYNIDYTIEYNVSYYYYNGGVINETF